MVLQKAARWLIVTLAVLLLLSMPATAASTATRVNVGSPSSPFAQNKQNEPAIAVHPLNPQILVAGANDEIDIEACNAGDPTTCPFTPGVGVSGVYFSFNGGKSWIQPTYTGWTARDCLGPAPCQPHVGPIGTLPWYYENGLVSDGDPALAFGPKPGPDGRFAWSNGVRLYYANLTANFSDQRGQEAFRGAEAIAVSRTDDLQAAANGDKNAWMPPVLVSQRLSTTTFSDKDNIWADNAASSPYFGWVYVCWVSFRSDGAAPEPLLVSHSSDGGDTWSAPVQVTAAANTGANPGRQGCQLRTDSKGTVYVFWEGFEPTLKSSVQYMARSFDGGTHFEQPRVIATVVDVGQYDPVQGDVTFDGVAGARTNSFPAVSIANGAPYGGGPDIIAVAWADARLGLNREQLLVQISTDGGNTWLPPVNAAQAGDRPDFPWIALSPNGRDLYVVYDAFIDPWRTETSSPRRFLGVVRHADTAHPDAWTTLFRGAIGDARGSSTNSLAAEFLGDYNWIVATDTAAFAVWNDGRNVSVCEAINVYRQNLASGTPATRPAPQQDCPKAFGNTDIYGGSFVDPTP